MIRIMEDKDIVAVQKVVKESWYSTYEGIIPGHIQDIFLEKYYNDEIMLKRLKFSHVYVVEEMGEIVGFANYSKVKDDGNCELSSIYLKPSVQRKGYGKKLLDVGICMEGVSTITLNVETENVKGVSFYVANGFQEIEKFQEEFEGHLLNTIRMKLNVKDV